MASIDEYVGQRKLAYHTPFLSQSLERAHVITWCRIKYWLSVCQAFHPLLSCLTLCSIVSTTCRGMILKFQSIEADFALLDFRTDARVEGALLDVVQRERRFAGKAAVV